MCVPRCRWNGRCDAEAGEGVAPSSLSLCTRSGVSGRGMVWAYYVMPTAVKHLSLLDIDPYTMKQVDELTGSLMDKVHRVGWNDMPVDEQVELRLLRTLLDGYAEPKRG